MRKYVVLSIITMLILIMPSALQLQAQESLKAVAPIHGFDKLQVNIAMPPLLDLNDNITVIVTIQRPDTQEFIDPDYIHVSLNFMGFKMAEVEKDDMQRLAKGIYAITFPPVAIPLLLTVNAEVNWITSWSEEVKGEASYSITLNYFRNITGRLLNFFKSFFNMHNLTQTIQNLYEKFMSKFSTWIETFKDFTKIMRLIAHNLFGFKKSAHTKAIILNVSTLVKICDIDITAIEAKMLEILHKARLVPTIQVINTLSDFWRIYNNESELNVIVIAPVQYFPLPNASSWDVALANMTIEMASRNWRVVLFDEPFRHLYFNNTFLDVGYDGWTTFAKWAGLSLWGPPPNYTVLSGVSLMRTTLVDKILDFFNISIPSSLVSNVIATSKSVPNDWGYEISGTDYVALFRIDSMTGISLVVAIPSIVDNSVLFALGLLGWLNWNIPYRIYEILASEITNLLQNTPFYDDIESAVNTLGSLINGDANISTILNEITRIGEWLSTVIVNPWQTILGALGGEFSTTMNTIASENYDIYNPAGAYSDVISADTDISSNLLQHVQAIYTMTILGGLSELPHLMGVVIEEAKKGHWTGSVNTTEAFTNPFLYQENMSAEDAVILLNQTINVIREMIANTSNENPYLNITNELLVDLEDISTLLNSILNNLTTYIESTNVTVVSTASLHIVGLLDSVWNSISKLSDKVNSLKNKLSKIWSKISALTGSVNALFSKVSEIWNYLSGFATTVQKWINDAKDSLQQAISGAVANVRDWVRNNVYEPLRRFVASSIEGLKTAFNKLRNWIVSKVNEMREWVIDKINYLKSKVNEIWNYVQNQVINPIIIAGKEFIKNAKSAIISFIDWIKSGMVWLWDKINDVATTIYDFFINLPNNVITLLSEFGAKFLRITWHLITSSVEWIKERVFSIFGINYYRVMNALRSIWNAIFKVVDFVKGAFLSLPEILKSFATKLRDLINDVVEFVKSAFSRVTEIIDKIYSGFSKITQKFTSIAGLLGQAKEFISKLVNISQWLGIVKYALNQLRAKSKQIAKTFISTSKQALQLGQAYKGENIRILGKKGSTIYFAYEKDGKLVKSKPLKVTVCGLDDNKVYGYAIASEVASGVYAVDTKDMYIVRGKEYVIVVEEFTLTSSQTNEDEIPSGTIATFKLEEIKIQEGSIAGYMVVEYPTTLYADKENYIRITIVNEKNTYADVDIVLTLLKNRIPFAQQIYSTTAYPGNNTNTFAFGPFYFALPAKVLLRVELKQETSKTTIEVETYLQFGLGNYLIVSGIALLLGLVTYSTIETLLLKRKLKV